MVQKHPICPERMRKIPNQFSWLDHRLVRDRHIDHCSHQAAALYLFLVTVADVQGLSYYSDRSVSLRLTMDAKTLTLARQELTENHLIAYKRPLYQVLDLDPPRHPVKKQDHAQLQSLRQIFKQIGEGSP